MRYYDDDYTTLYLLSRGALLLELLFDIARAVFPYATLAGMVWLLPVLAPGAGAAPPKGELQTRAVPDLDQWSSSVLAIDCNMRTLGTFVQIAGGEPLICVPKGAGFSWKEGLD